jgi:hypothetical protein
MFFDNSSELVAIGRSDADRNHAAKELGQGHAKWEIPESRQKAAFIWGIPLPAASFET